jgi:formate dehydrogenase subunit gamma
MQAAGKTPPIPSSTLDPETRAAVERALLQYQNRPGPLLQVLHAIQDAIGHVPAAAVPLLATALNLSRAEVHGVITFYHHFRDHAPGRHIVQVCQAEACRSMHCEQLTQHVMRRLQLDFGSTSNDGRFTLEPVYCLGNCACAPAIMLDGTLHGRVTPDTFDALIAAVDAP